jgi:hypothetical protein
MYNRKLMFWATQNYIDWAKKSSEYVYWKQPQNDKLTKWKAK